MAKPKKKTSVAKKAAGKTTKPVKPQSKPAKLSKPAPVAVRAKPVRETAASPAWDPNQVKVLVSRYLAKWPALSAAERAAFDSLSDDTSRAALGSRTKGQAVAADAARWIPLIDKALSGYALVREHYAPERFAYFLERVEGLRQALATQDSAGRGATAARSGTDVAADTARTTRTKLVRAMEKFAGGRKAERDALGAARDIQGTDSVALTRSIRELVTLASAWLESGSPILLKAARLDQALLNQARAAADALAESGADAREAGAVRPNDTPVVNIAEGWVLEEMRRVKSDFDDAHEENPIVERLVPGPSTRSAFGYRPPKSATTTGTTGTTATPPPAASSLATPPSPPASSDNAASSTSPTGPGVTPE